MVTTAAFAWSGRREVELAGALSMVAAPIATAFVCVPLNEVTGLLYLFVLVVAAVPVAFFSVTVSLYDSWRRGLVALLVLVTLYAFPLVATR